MINVCENCGAYAVKKEIIQDYALCPKCGFQQKFTRVPLFIISGASCVGKTSACTLLQQTTKDYVVMESDILWSNDFNTPEDNYRRYRELWLRMCKNISQCGKPVVLCGCAVPEQFENCEERRYFSAIHYLAIVCDEETLLKSIKQGRGVEDDKWIKSSVEFNAWLKENASSTKPAMALLDNTNKNKLETTESIRAWIQERQ